MMVAFVGRQVISITESVAEFSGLLAQSVAGIFLPPYRISEFFRHLNFIANGSLFIVAFCVSFAAMVTILESSFHMRMVIHNDSMVPGFAAMIIIRELGAIVTALLLTARVGAGSAAEVGTMKVTEQIDALKMLGIDPIHFIVVPRLLAFMIAGFLLTIVANVVCIFGAMLVTNLYLGYSPGFFLASMRNFVEFQDLILSGVKGIVFGAVIPLISCYYGFRCTAGAEGVGLATTKSVVAASVAIIVLDFCLSYLYSGLFY